MSREIYPCAFCASTHTIVRLPVAGKPWERKPYAVGCEAPMPLDPSRIRHEDERVEIRSRVNS